MISIVHIINIIVISAAAVLLLEIGLSNRTPVASVGSSLHPARTLAYLGHPFIYVQCLISRFAVSMIVHSYGKTMRNPS